jgi:hypothetical protein
VIAGTSRIEHLEENIAAGDRGSAGDSRVTGNEEFISLLHH